MSREANGAMELTFAAKSFNGNTTIKVGMCNEGGNCDKTFAINIAANDWREYRISLSCFGDVGVDMTKVETAFMLRGSAGVDVGIGNVRLESDLDAKPGCDGK